MPHCFNGPPRTSVPTENPRIASDAAQRIKFGIVSAGASPRPTEVTFNRTHLSVRAWGGGLILRGSTEEVKATGRPQVRTTEGSRRIAEFKIGKRMPFFPFLKVLRGLRGTFSKVPLSFPSFSPIKPRRRYTCRAEAGTKASQNSADRCARGNNRQRSKSARRDGQAPDRASCRFLPPRLPHSRS